MTSAVRYFIPVCLYPHTKYRTNAGIAALFQKYLLRDHDHLIVVADRLLVLDRLITGRYWTIEGALEKARREAKQISNMLRRASFKFGAQARGNIVYWDEIAERTQFKEFARRLRSEVLADPALAAAIENFADQRVERFGLGSAREREHGCEREYLLSEVCMSVFCTEVLGFWMEVWERPPAPNVPDPLRLLYNGRVELVRRVIEHPVKRVLNFLYDDLYGGENDVHGRLDTDTRRPSAMT